MRTSGRDIAGMYARNDDGTLLLEHAYIPARYRRHVRKNHWPPTGQRSRADHRLGAISHIPSCSADRHLDERASQTRDGRLRSMVHHEDERELCGTARTATRRQRSASSSLLLEVPRSRISSASRLRDRTGKARFRGRRRRGADWRRVLACRRVPARAGRRVPPQASTARSTGASHLHGCAVRRVDLAHNGRRAKTAPITRSRAVTPALPNGADQARLRAFSKPVTRPTSSTSASL